MLFILLCGLIFTGGVCDESLPPYRDPEDIFSGTLLPEYMFSLTQNYLDIRIRVVNTFDETFSAPSAIQGPFVISLERDTGYFREFTLSASSIRFGKYASGTGVLTMDPGDTLTLGVQWNFIDGEGRDLRQDVFRYYYDPNCSVRMIAKPESFILRGSLKIFERTIPVELGPHIFSLCHIDQWVSPRECVTISPAESCLVFE